jgi:hypothetical protein
LGLTLAASARLADDVFHLIGFAVLRCVEYELITKVRQKTFYFSFFEVLSGLTRSTYALRHLIVGKDLAGGGHGVQGITPTLAWKGEGKMEYLITTADNQNEI